MGVLDKKVLDSKDSGDEDSVLFNDGVTETLPESGLGRVSTTKSDIEYIFLKFKELHTFLTDNNIQLNSSEYGWLTYANSIDKMSINRMIFISNATWNRTKFSRYAEYIAILDTIYYYSFIPLIVVLIHEMNVNCSSTNFFPQGDTHKPKDDAEIVWRNILKVKNINQLNLTQDNADLLYQNARNIDLLLYSIASNY